MIIKTKCVDSERLQVIFNFILYFAIIYALKAVYVIATAERLLIMVAASYLFCRFQENRLAA